MDSETVIQFLIFLLWIFGGKFLRILRGGDPEPAQEGEDDLEEWDDEWKLPEEPAHADSAPPLSEDGRLPKEITTLEELHELEAKLEDVEQVAQKPVPQDYQAIAHLLEAYDSTQRLDERSNLTAPPRPPAQIETHHFSEKTTQKAVLLDGFLLSEILGTPRAYRPLRVGRAPEVPRAQKRL